jgi:hypothetical protein
MPGNRQEGGDMKRFLILAVVVALALILVVPAATAVGTELPSGVTVLPESQVLAAPGTTAATMQFVEHNAVPFTP